MTNKKAFQQDGYRPLANHTYFGLQMSLLVRWVLKWTGLQWCQPDVTNRVGQGWGLGGLMSDVWEWGPMSDVWGVPCLMSGVGVPCLMSGGCTVRSIASWIMLIWGTLPVNRQAWVKILHSHTFIGGGKDCMFQQKLKKSITGWPTRNVYRLILKVIVTECSCASYTFS